MNELEFTQQVDEQATTFMVGDQVHHDRLGVTGVVIMVEDDTAEIAASGATFVVDMANLTKVARPAPQVIEAEPQGQYEGWETMVRIATDGYGHMVVVDEAENVLYGPVTYAPSVANFVNEYLQQD